ncbi:DNA-binding transcriptional LysR family regulator [Actinocorallia herbida]|uniref:DNA-binding transcriptional LysR family regulator n=1 Tax=Actinocorallia herbida TaxID=58109 RepID=A0A3N1CS53_9ACTN|nr:LysR substrate-binding domain-containing protein [Actinocorallia herbida]ROO84035.1 DNA-binding transcriptional LysR family regulator [Actinocorallia herbida]
MNLVGHLECFVVVAEELHFGRAAARLGMAQPPLSQRIQRLEQELGTRLFDRSSRRVALTEPGRVLLEDARDLLVRVERIRGLADRAGDRAVLRAGLPEDLDGRVVAALIGAYRDVRPDLPLDLRPAATADHLRALAEGLLDVAVLRHPCDVSGLALGPMLGQPLGVLLPEDSPLAAVPVLPLADLRGHDLVVDGSAAPRADLLASCARHGFTPEAVHESPHPQFTLGLVLAGDAVALVPRARAVPGTAWRPLDGDPLLWRTSCAWRADTAPDGPLADLVDVTTRVLRAEAAMAPVASRVVPRPSSGFLA